jgi:hypothetical protein
MGLSLIYRLEQKCSSIAITVLGENMEIIVQNYRNGSCPHACFCGSGCSLRRTSMLHMKKHSVESAGICFVFLSSLLT